MRAAYRPRGGEWGPPENLDPGVPIVSTQPRVTVQPDGEFVAVWGAQGAVEAPSPVRWARRPSGGGWSAPDTITFTSSFPAISALEAGGDGSVTVMITDGDSVTTNRKAPGTETWGGDEGVPTGLGSRLAVGSDGSALAAAQDTCGVSAAVACVRATYRPPGGPWGAPEDAGLAAVGNSITGHEVAAVGTGYTLVFGEAGVDGPFSPPSLVRYADRGSGTAGQWSPPDTIDGFPNDVPFCPTTLDNCFDLAVGADGSQLAAWHHSDTSGTNPRILAALRSPGGAWGGAETVGATGTVAAIPFAALTRSGVPIVAWGSAIRGQGLPHGAHRAGADDWRERDLTGSKGPRGVLQGVSLGDLAVDAEGDAVTAWEETNGAAASGFDAAGPRFDALSLPSGGSVAFSAAATDNWSGPPGISWVFGDGTGASGAGVSHAYGAPGTYTATATATDAVGNATQQGGPVTVTQTPPPPDPCGTADSDRDGIKNGCDDSNGAARPRAFKTVNATVVSGEVFVKLPRGSAGSAQAKPPKGFVRLQGAETIPVGATLDTRRGRVKVRSAATTRSQDADGPVLPRALPDPPGAYQKRSKSLITDMRLTGSSFRSACGANRASVSQTRKRSKKRVRRLFGNAKGRSARAAATPLRPSAARAGASRTAATARWSRSRAGASRFATRPSARP